VYAVTGASGFVGLNLVEALLSRGDEVLCLSLDGLPAEAARTFEGLSGRAIDLKADVRDRPALEAAFRDHGVRRLFHGAVVTAAEARERRDAAGILEVNVVGTARVLEAAAAAGVERAAVASSSAAYGPLFGGTEPVREDAVPRPQALYGISKLAIEAVAARLAELHGLRIPAARIVAVFGPWERDTGLRDTLSPVWQIARLGLAGQPVRLPKGRRDWVWSRTVADALIAMLDGPTLQHGVYNIGPGQTWAPSAFCRALEPLLPGLDWREVDDPAEANVLLHQDPREERQPADVARQTADLLPGGHPPIEACLEEMARWVMQHPDWFR